MTSACRVKEERGNVPLIKPLIGVSSFKALSCRVSCSWVLTIWPLPLFKLGNSLWLGDFIFSSLGNYDVIIQQRTYSLWAQWLYQKLCIRQRAKGHFTSIPSLYVRSMLVLIPALPPAPWGRRWCSCRSVRPGRRTRGTTPSASSPRRSWTAARGGSPAARSCCTAKKEGTIGQTSFIL